METLRLLSEAVLVITAILQYIMVNLPKVTLDLKSLCTAELVILYNSSWYLGVILTVISLKDSRLTYYIILILRVVMVQWPVPICYISLSMQQSWGVSLGQMCSDITYNRSSDMTNPSLLLLLYTVPYELIFIKCWNVAMFLGYDYFVKVNFPKCFAFHHTHFRVTASGVAGY